MGCWGAETTGLKFLNQGSCCVTRSLGRLAIGSQAVGSWMLLVEGTQVPLRCGSDVKLVTGIVALDMPKFQI